LGSGFDRGVSGRGERVASAGNGTDCCRLSRDDAELPSDMSHVAGGDLRAGMRAAPDVATQPIDADHLAAILREQVEDAELRPGQLRPLLAVRDLASFRVERQRSDVEKTGRLRIPNMADATDDRLDPQSKLFAAIRLGDVVVRFRLERLH